MNKLIITTNWLIDKLLIALLILKKIFYVLYVTTSLTSLMIQKFLLVKYNDLYAVKAKKYAREILFRYREKVFRNNT